MKLEQRRHDGKTIWMIRPTRNVLQALERMHKPTADAERMCLLIGDPGMGKTCAGTFFAAQHKDVCYIDLPPRAVMQAATSPIGLLEDALGISASTRIVRERLDRVVDELIARPRMILLDTAHRLKYDHIDVFRFVHDKAGIPVCILSVPALSPMFDQHREFGSRLALRIKLQPATRDEIVALLDGYPEEVAAEIHRRTGGRIREVLQLRRLAELSTRSLDRLTPKQIQELADMYLAA